MSVSFAALICFHNVGSAHKLSVQQSNDLLRTLPLSGVKFRKKATTFKQLSNNFLNPALAAKATD